MSLWTVCGNSDITVREFMSMYKAVNHKVGWVYFQARSGKGIVENIPTSNKGWEKRFFFVSGGGWEFQPWENGQAGLSRVILKWQGPVDHDLNIVPNLSKEEIARVNKARDNDIVFYGQLVAFDYLREFLDQLSVHIGLPYNWLFAYYVIFILWQVRLGP